MINAASLDLELSSSQYAYCADNADISITGDITIEAWIKLEQLPSTAGTAFTIAGKYNAATYKRSYLLQINTDNKLSFIYSSNGQYDAEHISESTCDTAFVAGDVGKWIHVAVAVDVSAKAFNFYIDGVLKNDTRGWIAAAAIFDNDTRFAIGAVHTEAIAANFFDGKIDEVRLHNTIRSGAWILANKGKDITPDANCVGYWKMNNNYKDSAKSSDLTPVNDPVFSTDVPFVGEGGQFLLNMI